MKKDVLSKKEGTFIIFDNEGGLEYPDIDKEVLEYIEYNKEQIKKELIDNNVVIIRDYIVKIEELDLDFRNYFFGNFYNMISTNSNDLITLAYKDKKSGLYNKNLWGKICENIMSPISGDEYSMMVISIDNLNVENNIIKDISKTIRKNISHIDIAIRNNEYEFIIILPNKNQESAKEVLHNIKRDIDLNIAYGISYRKNKKEFNGMYKEIIKKISKNQVDKSKDFKLIKEHLLNITKEVEKNIKDDNIRKNIKNQIIEITNLIYKNIE